MDTVFWKAVAEFGLTIAIAGTSVLLMLWYVRRDLIAKAHDSAADRQTLREDIARMAGRITNQEEFIRDRLLTVVTENSKVLTIFAQTFEELNETIARLNGSISNSPCLWLRTLREEERHAVEQILDRTRKDVV